MDVLITDDSAFMRKVLHNIVKDLDFDSIYEAESGEDCLEKYRKHRPELVLLDIVMEGMSGIDALEKIKEIDEDQKVVMISAVGQEQMIDESLEKGALQFIEKPFENQEVKETLKKIVPI